MTQPSRRTPSRHRSAPPSRLGDREAQVVFGRRCPLRHAETPQDRHGAKGGCICVGPDQPEVESLETVRTSCCRGGSGKPLPPSSTAADHETEFTPLRLRPGEVHVSDDDAFGDGSEANQVGNTARSACVTPIDQSAARQNSGSSPHGPMTSASLGPGVGASRRGWRAPPTRRDRVTAQHMSVTFRARLPCGLTHPETCLTPTAPRLPEG